MDPKLKLARAPSSKRKIIVGETSPVPKKQNVVGLLSWHGNAVTCKSRKTGDMSLVYPGDCLSGQDVGKCSSDFGKRLDLDVRPDTVTSVRIVDKVPLDFRCTICKELPRLLNRSELYRHYAHRHFYSKLMKEFGHLKTCPVCKVDLKRDSIASHFGQKHSHVEHFLPVEAWIPISKVGASISRGAIGRCDRDSKVKSNRKDKTNEKLKKVEKRGTSLKEVPLVWPEIPQGFNYDGHERGVKRSFHTSKQPFRIATVNGFDIELEIDDDQENFVQGSELCSHLASAREQVMQCRICKKRFDTKQLVVLHVQTSHDMKGSGDDTYDYDALLRSGHIVPERIMNTADVPPLTIEGIEALNDGEFAKSQSLELTFEEVELDMAVENCQQNEVIFNLADGCAEIEEEEITEEDWENVCDAFKAKLEASGVQAKPIEDVVEKSDKEWEVACAAFESMIANICVSSDVLGLKDANEWGEVFAVESIKDLQDTASGRNSWSSAISEYISQHRADSS